MVNLKLIHIGFRNRLLKTNEQIRQIRKSGGDLTEMKVIRKELNAIVVRLSYLVTFDRNVDDKNLVDYYNDKYMNQK